MKIPGLEQLGQLGQIGDLMKQLKQFQAQLTQMREQVQQVQAELEAERLEASSGGGAVKAVASGMGELLEVKIDPLIIDPAEDLPLLEDLIVTAVRNVMEQAQEQHAQRLEEVTGGFSLPGLF